MCVYTWKNNHEERESVKPNGEAWTFSVQVTLKEKVFFAFENVLVQINRMMNSTLGINIKEKLGCNECVIHVEIFRELCMQILESDV